MRSQELLFHKNVYKEELYQIGDTISFQLKSDKAKITEPILEFEDSLIVFRGFELNPAKLQLCTSPDSESADSDALVFDGSFIAVGILTKAFVQNTIKIGGKRKLVIPR